VGNLPAHMTHIAVRELFASIGEVLRVTVMPDQGASPARSLAFVEMSEDAAALQAVARINGMTLDGQTVIVAVARFSAADGRGGYGAGWQPSDRPAQTPGKAVSG
jgi:RNA recognition motif-containing protein